MIRSVLAASALTIIVSDALAQGIEGGQIGLAFDDNLNHGNSQTTLGGSLGFGLGGLSLQGDVSKRINSDEPGAMSLGAHAIANVGEQSAVGAFLTYDNLSGTAHDYNWGVEGKFAAGQNSPFVLEGYLMRVTRNANRSNFNALGVDAELGVGPASAVTAGYFSTDDAADLSRYSIGLSQELTPNVSVGLTAARQNSGTHHDTMVGLTLDYTFGKGATFGRRGYPQLTPGF